MIPGFLALSLEQLEQGHAEPTMDYAYYFSVVFS